MATRRGYYRAELRRSQDNIDMCLTHLDRFIEAYSQDYPELANNVLKLGEALIAIRDTIQKVHDAI